MTLKPLKELEKGYVRTNVNVWAYEEGEFRGFPRHLPKTCPAWQDRGYGFSTHLVLLQTIAEKNGEPSTPAKGAERPR